ncbi:hypothetical protein PUN28_001370 [Cardiocondyla obscurior]|uniref:Ig-like domain-containing protein n=1 Tax=Cardiocondyla obscurior TaxID=286306 RepID=A0AAW2H5C4_9HYME
MARTRVAGGRTRRERGCAPQARKLGKSQGRGCAWCAGQPEGASSGSSCALPLGCAIGGAFLPANTCPGERVLDPEQREQCRAAATATSVTWYKEGESLLSRVKASCATEILHSGLVQHRSIEDILLMMTETRIYICSMP